MQLLHLFQAGSLSTCFPTHISREIVNLTGGTGWGIAECLDQQPRNQSF